MKQFMWFRATYISLRPYLGNLQHVHTMPGQLRIARAGQDASLFLLGPVDNQQVQMKAAASATNDENRSESLS